MKTVVQLVVVAILAVAGWFGWQNQDKLPFLNDENPAEARGGFADREIAVEVKPARLADLTLIVRAVGTARANEAVEVTTKTAGLIRKIEFREGQSVHQGTVLVTLESTELEAELAEAQAGLANARQLYARAAELLKTRNVPQARVDELAQQVAAAEAAVAATKARLADYVIRAPFSGRLGMRDISAGALLRPGDRITTLDDTSTIKLDFDIPERNLADVRPGLKVRARSAAYGDLEFAGVVTTVDSRVDPVTRSVQVRARIPNRKGLLRPGMFLTVSLTVGTRPQALMLPEEAVLSSSSGPYVFSVEGDRVVRRAVTLGERQAGEVEVLNGVGPGVKVITGGVQKVRDGTKVKIIPPIGGGEPTGASGPTADGSTS